MMPNNKIYSPRSPMLNGSLHHHYLQSGILSPTIEQEHQTKHDHDQQQYQQHFSTESPSQCTNQCLKFRYFTIFLVCTTCLTLLSASLATHKWIISRPIRMLKLNNGQKNSTALMLSASLNDHHPTKQTTSKNINDNLDPLQASLSIFSQNHQQQNNPNPPLIDIIDSNSFPDQDGFVKSQSVGPGQNKKFQGEIYFGLFRGLKILNYGFGDRQSSISVSAPFMKELQQQPQQDLVNFKLWLLTLTSVSLAILFALIGSIFAIINFVMIPQGTLTGPIGLVIWNATSCLACLVAAISWTTEFFVHLQSNVLTQEELNTGWTSEGRSQFGYSYYLVISAMVLHLVNIFIVSLVKLESWAKSESSKRLARPVCEGVTMLY